MRITRPGQHMARSNPERRPSEKPSGLSMWGYIWLLLGIAVVVTLVLRLAPHYMNFQTLQSVMEGIDSGQVHGKSKRSVYDLLQKRFKINGLYDLKPTDIATVERQKNQTVVSLDYEVRESLIANADVVLTFQKDFAFQPPAE
ncbi:MAG: DUF4845 domain-containing protein [Pseudomonadota bacterium]